MVLLREKIVALIGATASLAASIPQHPGPALDTGSGNHVSSRAMIDIDGEPTSALDATAWSIIYTYPFVACANIAGGVIPMTGGVNKFMHQRDIPRPGGPDAGTNIDVLYTIGVFDISQNDLVLTIPDIGDDRYWVHAFYDLYGDPVAEIGVGNQNKAGGYLIRRDAYGTPGFSSVTNDTELQGAVTMGSAYGSFLFRIGIKANTTEEKATINGFQDQLRLETANLSAADPASSLNDVAPNGSLLGMDSVAKQFEFAAKLMEFNPPTIPEDSKRITRILGRAGLEDGQYNAQPGTNLTLASEMANSTMTADFRAQENRISLGNGWSIPTSSYQGPFLTSYAPRAILALAGSRHQSWKQAVYPEHEQYSTLFTITNETSLLTFNGKPPVNTPGFWNMIIHGPGFTFVDNSLNRYAVGSQSLYIRYPDGDFVYGPNADSSRDGPFQILVQRDSSPPPSN